MFALLKKDEANGKNEIVMQVNSKTNKTADDAYNKFKLIANEILSMSKEDFESKYSIHYLDMVSLGDNTIIK